MVPGNSIDKNSYAEVSVLIVSIVLAFFLLRTSQRQNDYAFKRPYLRIQWKPRELLYDGDVVRNSLEKYGKFTALELINTGKGIAKNVQFELINIASKIVRLKNITSMSAEGGTTQLRYINQEEDVLDKESCSEIFFIVAKYQNIDDEWYEVKFVLNNEFNDGFKIEYQKRISFIKKIKNKIFVC